MRIPIVERSLAVTGPAAPEVVWLRYEAPSRWVAWAPHLTGVDCSSPVIRPGARGTVRAAGVVPVRFEITDVDPQARTWAWTAWLGPVRLRLHHGVEPTDGGTRATLRVAGPVGLVEAYLPLAAWALRRLTAEVLR